MLSSISSGVLLTACFLGIQAVEAGQLRKRVFQATPRQAASSYDISTSNSLLLSRTTSPGGVNSRSAAFALASSNSSSFTAEVLAHFNGESFSTTISWGNESFDVIIDTGSSDTWLVETGFTCLDYLNASVVDPENCAFGPTYNLTDTFKQIEGEHFNMSYADGEYITGIMGHELVTLGGLELNQTVGLVDVAAWNGDGFSSGLVGLSYPPLTSAFNGTDPDEDTEAGRINYDPIFVTAEKSGEIAPVFSLAIFRNVSGPAGYLTLGGLPPVDFEPGFISTPILITRVGGFDIDYDFYTINIEDILLNNASINGLFNTTCDNCTDSSAAVTQYIVDSGTTLNYFPTAMANAINSAFSPPATYDENEGSYIVSCNATAPTLSITIAGKTFPTNALDMIIFTGTDEDTGEDSCITGIMDGGEPSDDPLYILGDTFLKNVVAVFDVGAGEMRFAVHTDYESNDYV